MEIFLFIVALIIMLIGLVGVIIPAVPGVPIVFLGTIFFGLFTGFEKLTGTTILLFIILCIISFLLDWLSGLMGAKKFGATKWGIVGSIIGAIIGGLIFNIPGAILGPIIGAIAFEIFSGREFQESLRAGIGVFIGFLVGTIGNIVLATTMITLFVKAII